MGVIRNMAKHYWKIGGLVGSFLILLIVLLMTAGINDAGYRTMIQYPSGTLKAKLSPGLYVKYFGESTVYVDVITFDFDDVGDQSGSTLDQEGIAVRYSDGGSGTVYGKARFQLPSDQETMIAIHKQFRTNQGLANKLIKSVVQEAMNLTAALMTSEEGYAERRAEFTQLARSQISEGPFQTELSYKTVKDEVTGETVTKRIPIVKLTKDTLQQIHNKSDLANYGIQLIGFQMNSPSFEEATMEQISRKREATMAIITAKANAEKAKQDAITTKQQGLANVMAAKYEQEVEKEKAVVMAQREKEVTLIDFNRDKEAAIIRATQRVDVAKQARNEAEQKKLAAVEYKEEQILIGAGDAERKRLVIEADGALEQKLATYEVVMANFAEAVGKQKWVAEVQMGPSSGGSGSNATELIDLFTVKVAQDLGLDAKIQGARNADVVKK